LTSGEDEQEMMGPGGESTLQPDCSA